LVDLGAAGGFGCFETESLLVRNEGIWLDGYVLNTAAVENTGKVDRDEYVMHLVDFLKR
jgi:hypothetical protein